MPSPTPWIIESIIKGNIRHTRIADADGATVLNFTGDYIDPFSMDRENLEHIVKCVNEAQS